jgi:hypothetical protein
LLSYFCGDFVEVHKAAEEQYLLVIGHFLFISKKRTDNNVLKPQSGLDFDVFTAIAVVKTTVFKQFVNVYIYYFELIVNIYVYRCIVKVYI